MALAYANINYEHREILLKSKPQSMLGFSPKGTVPVLVFGDNVIDESLEIMYWVLAQRDNDNWLMFNNDPLQNDMQQLIQLCDKKFKTQLDFYKYSDRYELTRKQYRDQSLWFLMELNNRLTHQQFLISD